MIIIIIIILILVILFSIKKSPNIEHMSLARIITWSIDVFKGSLGLIRGAGKLYKSDVEFGINLF